MALDLMRVEPANVYSQFGEDAILAALFAKLHVERGRLVEVGAWDGVHLSNCRALLDHGWSGVHIEADPDRAEQLRGNVVPFGSHAVQAMVGPCGTPLTRILDDAGEPRHVHLLSIDIDSDDLAVFDDFTGQRTADCVIIEFNPSVPNDITFINTPGQAWGNSALAIHQTATARGYTLVAHTACNLIYITNQLAKRFVAHEIRGGGPGQLRTWWGYDGTLFMSTVEAATHDPRVQPQDPVQPPWGQPAFPQPVPTEARVWVA